MKIYTSYFYQIRFFKPYMIPLSTAMFDPKWFHQFKNKNYHFKDKNGVLNGLRAEPFVPNNECNGECRGLENCDIKNPNECLFLKNYYKQLSQLNFQEILKRFKVLAEKIKRNENLKEEPIMVLIVYETPNNKCSEREIIHKWFKDNNYPIEELEYPIKRC